MSKIEQENDFLCFRRIIHILKNAFILGLILRIIESYQIKISSLLMCYVQHTAGADVIYII